jgi:2-iminoacetate synthase ThiH
VVSSAGTTHRASISEMERCILDAGYAVRRRRQDYTIIEPETAAA